MQKFRKNVPLFHCDLLENSFEQLWWIANGFLSFFVWHNQRQKMFTLNCSDTTVTPTAAEFVLN